MAQWQGRVLVLNFWATWCAPCRDEVPGLVKIQRQFASKNVQIVGIAIDSAPEIQKFSREFKINYPLVVSGIELTDLMRRLGNPASGLPFTVILDPSGRVFKVYLGRISEDELDLVLNRLII